MNKAISFDDIETERQRGDTYRARALALLRSARYNKYWKRHWKMMVLGMAGKLGAETGLRTACDFLNSQLAAERQAREAAEARAAGLAELLKIARLWVYNAKFDVGDHEAPVTTVYYRADVLSLIEAALSDQPPAGGEE